MKEHIFLCIDRNNQQDQGHAGLFEFADMTQAQEHLRQWLTKSCGLDCYSGSKEEALLRSENGGELPELAFACPEVKTPEDLEQYSGFYFYGSGGAVSIFITAIYDEASARRFRAEVTKEFKLDQLFSEEADEMLDMLEALERSFLEEMDYSLALEKVDSLIRHGGLGLF